MKTVKQLYARDTTNNATGYNQHTVNLCQKSNN